jgi:predicted transcriptional regulator of viral defense system
MIAMRSLTTPDRRLARLAGRQHGVVSRAQLYELGFDNPAVERRIASGRLHRLHRGVYSVGHTIVNRDGRYLAATLATGGVLSHRSAAALWGLRPSAAARIDVTVSHTSGVRSSARIAVHRSRREPNATRRNNIPVTTPGQTLLDLATALPRRELEKACEQAEVMQLSVHLDETHPGTKRLNDVLATHDLTTHTRSPLEDAFLALCDRFEIPRPLVNTVVEGHEVDFCWPDERLIVETDGRRHATLAAFETDRRRDAELTASGWRVMRFTTKRIERDAAEVAALVISARSPLLVTP